MVVLVLVFVLLSVVVMAVVMLGRKFPQFYISQLPIDRSAAVTGMHNKWFFGNV